MEILQLVILILIHGIRGSKFLQRVVILIVYVMCIASTLRRIAAWTPPLTNPKDHLTMASIPPTVSGVPIRSAPVVIVDNG